MPVERPEIIKLIKSMYIFKKLDDVKTALVADSVVALDVPAETAIYQEGEPADKLYIVFKGKVRISRTSFDEEESLGILDSGNLFGYEMLEYDNQNLATATAIDSAVLLCLDRERTRVLLEQIDTLNLDLKILYESYKLQHRVKLNWREPDDAVIYLARQHGMYLFLKLIPVILFSIISLIIISFLIIWTIPIKIMTPQLILVVDIIGIFIWGLLTYIDWSNDYAFITSQRTGYIEKVILMHDSRREAPLNAVLSVTTDTDFWGRALGYGDVSVRTYAGSFVFPHMAFPKQVAALLGVLRERTLKQRVETEQSELEDVIRVRLGFKPRRGVAPVGEKTKKETSGLQRFFAGISKAFQLRKETADTVTWRTHWIMLLKCTFLPSLLIIGSILLIVLRFLNYLPILPLQAVMLLAIIIVLIGLGWWVYAYLDWSNDIYIVTPDQVLDVNHKPLAQEERRAAPLKNILSVEFQQNGIIALLFNYGTVYIGVGETKLTFDDVPNPADVQRELFKRLAMRDYREKHNEIEAEQKRVANWIAAYHRVIEEERKTENHAP